ncbi:tryptophan synthase subunit beta [Chlamydia sp.]|uniref:tryptophan synthase subunit beta n=1 Tax=Chlamydia sp. TaxID=35827 RepID=UPI0025BBDE89|nr:tryptophan synthase subunit beta [Chlamydia sp.]MBQ8498392.1 tryptophan synthase subunit beta [Chlamydia sp.]
MHNHPHPFGGAFLPEELLAPIQDLQTGWDTLKTQQKFLSELDAILKNYAGRPTPLTEVKNFACAIDGPRVFLKREDLLHTGAHKINNALGQCLLAKYLGKNRVVAETGAGQHGVATATACAYLGLNCVVYMGAKDVERQKPNVERMRFLGAEVVTVTQGSSGLKDAVNQALQDWAFTYSSTHYCLGSALGPLPYPEIVRSFQSVISFELKEQIHAATGRDPDILIACIGGGSNAIGFFHHFIPNPHVRLIGVEGGGLGIASGKHAARFATGRPGVLHGFYSYLLQDHEGQILPTHSISAGLDYPSVGPDHAEMHESGRAFYTLATDEEALQAFFLLTRNEGIIPALESSHALAHLVSIAPSLPKEHIVVVNLSGRGDKDLPQIIQRNKGIMS